MKDAYPILLILIVTGYGLLYLQLQYQRPVIDSFSVSSLSPLQGEAIEVSLAASDSRGLRALEITVGEFSDTFSCDGQSSCATTWSVVLDSPGTYEVLTTAIAQNSARTIQRKEVVVAAVLSGPVCGNGVCDAGETAAGCPSDCASPPVGGIPACGNGLCDPGETGSCPADCPSPPAESGEQQENQPEDQPLCGNGVCETGEDTSSCRSDCGVTSVCGNGLCESGETNAACPADCPSLPVLSCGNTVCDSGETSATCPADCPPSLCGDGICNGTETAESCPADCPVPPTHSADAFGVFDLTNDDQSLAAIGDLDVTWVRVQFRMGETSLATLTTRTNELFAQGYNLWLTIYHRDPANIADPAALGATSRGGYPPVDDAMYTQLVADTLTPLVDQIRTAGKSPASSLVVQSANEVIPTDVAPDTSTRFFHGSGDEYLRTLSLTYDAAKSVDPGIPVAMAGISSQMMESVIAGEQPTADWNNRLLTEGRFDWADIHIRNEIERIDDKIDWIRERWSGPIAATEVGGPCDSSCTTAEIDAYTEEVQAADLPDRIQTLLGAGADRVFWASLVESPDQELQYQKEGLIRPDWTRKPAFDAYRDLIAELT